ncbi:MAG: cysteine protease StiP domain-containing protein [Gemmataceae bacterium]
MRTVVFLDLDDTLFQTRRKCPAAEPLHPAAVGRDGEPLSFMTAGQRALFDWLRASATLIPTTARDWGAFQRVQLPFSSWVILDFGGVILRPDGTLDPDWDATRRPQALALVEEWQELLHQCQEINDHQNLGLRLRVIHDFDMPLYFLAKHPADDIDRLRPLRELLDTIDPERFFVHHNDNNLCLVPRFLGKEYAVRHLIDRHFRDEPTLTIGIGDSSTDGPFLRACQFALLPTNSQLMEQIPRSQAKPGNEKNEKNKEKFSGSYPPEDVHFLLKPVQLAPTPIAEKERLIQSGQRHYSEMISREALPSPVYLRIFHEALEKQKRRFARDLLILAGEIARRQPESITLVSLARAGTPIGVLLTRVLRQRWRREVAHYSISIIRDRGIDKVALRYILARHPAEAVVFVDGWTGKGIMASELYQAVTSFNARHDVPLDPGLYVVADLCGAAAVAATSDDYLIPSCVLGCTISGLVSRSILNDSVIAAGEFHGCLYYREYAEHDLSNWFMATMLEEIQRQETPKEGGVSLCRDELRRQNARFVAETWTRFGLRSVHHIKPGIGEATRVLLRRMPERLLLRDTESPEVAHLLQLAREKKVPWIVEPTLPYRAAAVIKEINGA